MSSSKKRSGFQITSVTSDLLHLTSTTGRLSPSVVRTVQSDASSFGRPQGSSSQPSTPSLKRKHISHGALGQRAGCSSRFRVVRLAGGRSGARGRNELYRRGRWTCMEFMEQQEGVGYRRVMDSMRHAHSLESLEMIGRDTERGVVYSEDTAHLLAQPLRVSEGAGLVLHSGPLSPVHQEPISIQHLDKSWPEAGLVVQSGPPSPVHQEPISIQHLDRTEPITEQGLNFTPPPASPRPQSFPRPLRQLDADATRRSVLRASQSLPSSPPSYRPTLTSVRTPSAFSLDQTIFNLSGDSSASSNSLQAIDNKIERAMDLVKSHLMLAVREEVEIMREQIRELQEKNQQLERENHILRTLTHNYTTT